MHLFTRDVGPTFRVYSTVQINFFCLFCQCMITRRCVCTPRQTRWTRRCTLCRWEFTPCRNTNTSSTSPTLCPSKVSLEQYSTTTDPTRSHPTHSTPSILLTCFPSPLKTRRNIVFFSLCVCLCLSVSLSLCLCLCVCLPACLPVCLTA